MEVWSEMRECMKDAGCSAEAISAPAAVRHWRNSIRGRNNWIGWIC